MDPNRFKLLKTILADALELPHEEQIAFVTQQCGDDAGLLEEIKALLITEIESNFLNKESIPLELDGDIPVRIGRIKVDQLIAAGGMGKVFVGTDELLKRQVAIKVMHPEMHQSVESRSAFLNEAQVLSSLQHPNICQIYDFFVIDEKDILVLEYINGITLKQAIKNNNVSSPLQLAHQIITALCAAHEQGIVHRDLKPDNVMLTTNGEVKILDFGLAKVRSLQSDSPNTSFTFNIDEHTPKEQTHVSGTPGYMSPEQARGVKASAATDLWSFGLILSELLTGKPPFSSESSTPELLAQAREGAFQAPQNLPRDQRQLINSLLTTTPSQRPSARMTLDAINRIIDKPKRRIKLATISLLATVALLFTWKYTHDLNHERNIAVQARNQAEELVDYMLTDLYTGLRSVGRTDLLEAAASQALQYYGNLSDEQMQRTQGKPATAMLQIAEVLSDQGNKTKAIETIELTINKLKILQTNQPDNSLINFRLAEAYISAADILRIAGELKLTKEYAYKATVIGQQLTQGLEPGIGPSTQPNGTDRWRVYLRSIYLHADGHMRLGERTEAIELLEKVVLDAIPAAATNPKLLINLSDIQFKRCGTYYDANLTLKMLDPCLALFEIDQNLFQQHPDDYQKLKNHVGNHGVIANVYRKLGELDEALKYAQAGIVLGEEMILWDPDNENTLNEFVTVLLALGRTQLKLGQKFNSQQTFKRALEIIAPIAADQEEITYMNSYFTALIFLGQLDAAREVAKVLQTRAFKRRDYQDLCIEFKINECGILTANDNAQ